MIKANKVLKKKKSNILKTTNYPKVTGIVYKLKGEIGETLYVSYDNSYDCLRYVGDDLQEDLKNLKTKEELLEKLSKYRSLHDNDYKKVMKPIYFTDDYTEKDLKKLYKYNF